MGLSPVTGQCIILNESKSVIFVFIPNYLSKTAVPRDVIV